MNTDTVLDWDNCLVIAAGDDEDADIVYFDVIEANGQFYAFADVDCNSRHFTDYLLRMDGPYETEKQAFKVAYLVAMGWFDSQGYGIDDVELCTKTQELYHQYF